MAMKENELPLFFVLLASLFKLNLFGANIFILYFSVTFLASTISP